MCLLLSEAASQLLLRGAGSLSWLSVSALRQSILPQIANIQHSACDVLKVLPIADKFSVIATRRGEGPRRPAFYRRD